MRIINKLKDDQYPASEIKETRTICRAILVNEKNEICLLHVQGDDIFGHRDYYETPGGGVKDDETLEEAVLREVKEETGCEGYIYNEIGIVEDYYNLINRKNINYYFIVKVKSYGERALEDYEKSMIQEMKWIEIGEAFHLIACTGESHIALLCKRRELPIIQLARKILLKDNLKKLFNNTIKVTIDRPVGSKHPKFDDIIYPFNYGYYDKIVAGDDNFQDVYLIDSKENIKSCDAKVIAIAHRFNDVEDKLIVTTKNEKYTKEEIYKAISFQEKYFNTIIIMPNEE